VVARVSLNMLRSRERRREEPLDLRVPDPIVGPAEGGDPEHEALLADSVGLALMVVLGSLSPDERLAFVLHDTFAVPFDVIAPLLERSPAATRQLASRARRRVREQAPAPDPDPARQRQVVDAYLSAARHGDFDALVGVLHPDIVLRADGGKARARYTTVLRGAQHVAGQAVEAARRLAPFARPVLVNGAAGVVTVAGGRVISVMAFTVAGGKIAAIDVLMDPERLADLDVAELGLGD
jgi:RNA polymerase sigma-70 factor (ECF subfamily)